MKMVQITAARYVAIVEQYNRQGVIVNDYILGESTTLAEESRLYGICGKDNAVILVKSPVGMRVYYYINNLDERVELPQGDYVIEVLFRQAIGFSDCEVGYWERIGFKKNLVRDQYCCPIRDIIDCGRPSEETVGPAESIGEVADACNLFNSSFDHLSGDYISEAEFPALLAEGQILVARGKNGDILGALHHQKSEKVSWLHHLAVKSEARGKGVGSCLCGKWIEIDRVSDKTRFMLWVQRQNAPAVSLYEKMGFKHNGKSSLSLIKRTTENG